MAPGAQTASEYVNGRLGNGVKAPMTLEERRQKMREGISYIRGSQSPKPTLHRFGSFSSAGRPATSFEDRPMFHKPGGDRWDTDTERLDDSTIDGLDYAQARSYGDLARSPAPEESTEVSELSEVSEITDDEDKYSVSVSVRTEPANNHAHSYPVQSLNGALSGHGQNTWTNTTRTKVINRAPSGSISGNDYHQKYFQQHNFRQGFTVGTSNAIPFHTRSGHSPSLRTRDTSAPPLRSRAISPIMGERVNGHRANGHSTGHIPTGETIDEEYSPPLAMEVGQARTIRITRQPSLSNMSQASGMSRASSVSDLRGMRSPGGTRFRTKRSHVIGRKRNRSLAQELDYSPTELAGMDYRTLAEESFDDNPKARNMKPVTDFPPDVDTLQKRCEFVRRLPEKETGGGPQVEETRTPQEVFFASLTIDEYDECGELIVEQLSALMGQLRRLRRAKRKAAMDMEDEVARRQESVSTKMTNLQSELTRLKKSGQEALAAAASKV